MREVREMTGSITMLSLCLLTLIYIGWAFYYLRYVTSPKEVRDNFNESDRAKKQFEVELAKAIDDSFIGKLMRALENILENRK